MLFNNVFFSKIKGKFVNGYLKRLKHSKININFILTIIKIIIKSLKLNIDKCCFSIHTHM